MKFCYIMLLLPLLSLNSCQSLGLFEEPFLQEINKFKPKIKKNAELNNIINDFIKTHEINKNKILKTVNLSDVMGNDSKDFLMKLIKSSVLPASDHYITSVQFGGQTLNINDKPLFISFEVCEIGVVIKGSEPNTVYSLIYDLNFKFNRTEFNDEYNLNITHEEEKEIINHIFYNIAYDIYIFDMLPFKSQTKCIIKNKYK